MKRTVTDESKETPLDAIPDTVPANVDSQELTKLQRHTPHEGAPAPKIQTAEVTLASRLATS
ncbi:MAG: hypothetical protein ACLP0A_01190 [Verrucomicrobiia bacterium]